MSDINYSFEKLNGTDNFDVWYSDIYDYIKSKKCSKYIDKDYISFFNITNESTKAEKSNYENCCAEDAKASAIINANVSEKIKFLIKYCQTAYSKMFVSTSIPF